MPSYPFFSFPNYRRNYYPPIHTPNNYYAGRANSVSSNSNYNRENAYKDTQNINYNTEPKNHYSGSNVSRSKFNEKTNYEIKEDDDERSYNENKDYGQCFEIFGIKIHLDDLILIALLFLFYKEENDDISIFIILFLLLLN